MKQTVTMQGLPQGEYSEGASVKPEPERPGYAGHQSLDVEKAVEMMRRGALEYLVKDTELL